MKVAIITLLFGIMFATYSSIKGKCQVNEDCTNKSLVCESFLNGKLEAKYCIQPNFRNCMEDNFSCQGNGDECCLGSESNSVGVCIYHTMNIKNCESIGLTSALASKQTSKKKNMKP